MDKQLIEEFNKKYFGKNQLKRRIYNQEELYNIWKIISVERQVKSISVDLKLDEENKIWYNITDDMKIIIDYINDSEKSGIINYLNKMKNNKANENNNDKRVMNIDTIEKYYTELYNGEGEKEGVYAESKKQFLLDVFKFIEENETCEVLIKSAILNFYISNLAPFISYNIEMAEEITNRYLINNGYEIMRYCNTLSLIKDDERRYYNAIEDSRINDGDITYFIKYYIGIIQGSIKELTKQVSVNNGKKIIKDLMDKNNVSLEERQIKFINGMILLSNNKVNIDDYKKKTKVSYETARSDLNVLVALGFFKISKLGKKYEYYFNDISTIIDNFNDISVSF